MAQAATLFQAMSNYSSGFHTRTSHQDIYRGAQTSHENPRRTCRQAPTESIFQILMQGPVEEGFNKIPTQSSRKDLYKIMQGPLRGLHQDLYKIFSQGMVKKKTFDQDLPATTPNKNCPRASRKSFHASSPTSWHLLDLHARTS